MSALSPQKRAKADIDQPALKAAPLSACPAWRTVRSGCTAGMTPTGSDLRSRRRDADPACADQPSRFADKPGTKSSAMERRLLWPRLASQGDQGAPTPVPERFMPDTAPDEPGIVGPVGVPPDPPALLLPNPMFGWNPEVVAGPVKPPPRLRRWAKPPMWACCAKAALVVPAINKTTSNRKCLLRMTPSFRF
jgi:hypothetical protein